MSVPLQILGFGAVSIDDIIYVDRPLEVGKGRIRNRARTHGGNVATALCVAATLGAKAGFAGWMSNRSQYRSVAEAFEAAGVDLTYSSVTPEAKPVRSTIIVDSNGERFIAFDDDADLGPSDRLDRSIFLDSQVLLVDSYAFSSVSLIAEAREAGMQVVADLEWSVGDETDRLVQLCDHLVLPWDFAVERAGGDDPAILLTKLWTQNRKAVVVTKGGDGCFIRQRNDPVFWHLPADVVPVLDTTGCGDCFHGAYAAALVSGKEPLECARYASAAAAISATGRGGRGALPSHEDCTTLMAQKGAPVPEPLARHPTSGGERK